MGRKRVLAIGLTIVISGLAWTVSARAQSFSADLVGMDLGHDPTKGPTHIAVSGQKMRVETGKGAVLVDGAAGSMTVLDPDKKMAIIGMNKMAPQFSRFMTEIDPDNACPQWQAMARETKQGADPHWTCQRVGNETLDGRSVVRYEATNDKGEHTTAWIDSRLHFPLKIEAPKGGMTLSNIKEGPQSAALFDVPADYQKMDMSAMMQGMGKIGRPSPQ